MVVIEDGLNSSVEKTGIGSYTRRLIECLDSYDHEFDIKFVECNYAKGVKNYWLRRLIYRVWKNFLFEFMHLQKGDILHTTHFRTSILRRSGIKRIYTIHDLVAKNYNYCLPAGVRSSAARVVDKAISQADEIIVPNAFIKSEIIETFSVEVQPDRINTVVYSAVGPGEYEKADPELIQDFGKYFLSIGTIEIRKNLNCLISAFEVYCESSNSAKCNLVLVGKRGYGSDQVLRKIGQSKFKSRIHYLSFVSNDMLASLLSNTTAFIFPSVYEGFGLPALEAVSLRKPVIASDIGTFKAIGSDYFHFFGAPEDTSKLTLYLSLAEHEQLEAKQSVGMLDYYSSENVAKTHLDVYRKCCSVSK